MQLLDSHFPKTLQPSCLKSSVDSFEDDTRFLPDSEHSSLLSQINKERMMGRAISTSREAWENRESISLSSIFYKRQDSSENSRFPVYIEREKPKAIFTFTYMNPVNNLLISIPMSLPKQWSIRKGLKNAIKTFNSLVKSENILDVKFTENLMHYSVYPSRKNGKPKLDWPSILYK